MCVGKPYEFYHHLDWHVYPELQAYSENCKKSTDARRLRLYNIIWQILFDLGAAARKKE